MRGRHTTVFTSGVKTTLSITKTARVIVLRPGDKKTPASLDKKTSPSFLREFGERQNVLIKVSLSEASSSKRQL